LIRVASARAGNVIGGGDWANDRIVPDCIRAIRSDSPITVRNKTATRPWQHVLEPLSGYLWLGAQLASSSDKCFQGAFNFGPDTASNRTVAELVTELITHTGGQWIDASDSNGLHEASKLNLATEKAFHLLKWESVWDFKKTIEATAVWYLEESSGKSVAALTQAQITDYQNFATKKSLPWALPTTHNH
jgi:CDP-glucose 4,6-dehydratase